MKDALSLPQTQTQTFNFIKNLTTKVNNIENAQINSEHIKAIENNLANEDKFNILNDITIALLNFIWPTEHESIRNITLKKFIKHVLKFSNTTISIYVSAIYYLLSLKENSKFNNLLQRIQLEIENTKQEQGFINGGNLQGRCCGCCGAYISCYKNDSIVCKCRLFLLSLVLACKFGQDKNYSNKAWSKISKFSVSNINYNERFFLNLVDYSLYIDDKTYKAFASLIFNHIINMENQKKKLQCRELMNLSKMNTLDINNVHEWKKYLEKKAALTKKLQQLEVIRYAKLKYDTIQNKINENQMLTTVQSLNIQKLSPEEINHIPSIPNNAFSGVTSNPIQKLSPLEEQIHSNSSNLNNETNNKVNGSTSKTNDIAAISPISPSGVQYGQVNANNVNISAVYPTANAHTKTNVNYIPSQQELLVQALKYRQLSNSVNQPKPEVKPQQQLYVSPQNEKKSEQLTLENFSSFIQFYKCINNKLSTTNEQIIKATSSYKALSCALNLAYSKRLQDALSLLNHIINGTMDICKEILSLALKGQMKNALVYVYLLTPSEINFFNNNIRTPNLKSLTPQDVLSIVSILLNCVQKKSTQQHEVKSDLLGNLGNQNQVNISSTQTLLLKFIQNINNSLCH